MQTLGVDDTDRTPREDADAAGNPNTAPELLTELGRCTNTILRAQVGHNPSTPTAVLVELSIDERPLVREAVATNPHLPAEVLQRLTTDPNTFVRAAVAANPNTPGPALAALAVDSHPDVVAALRHQFPDLSWAAHRPSYVRTRNCDHYHQLVDASADPVMLTGLAPTWTSSLDLLLRTVAELANREHP